MTLYEQSRPGRATPNPVYKPGQEAAARKSSSGSGGSGPSGQTSILINPENIIKSDIAGIDQVAISGTGSQNLQYKIGDKIVTEQEYAEKRESELNPQPIAVAVDYAAVNQYNQYMASQGIKNAQEYFEAVRNPQTDQITVTQTPPQLREATSYPKRRIAPEETEPYSQELEFKDPFPARPGSSGSGAIMNIMRPEPKETMKRTTAGEINFQLETAQTKIQAEGEKAGNEPLKIFTYIPEAFAYGMIWGAKELGTGLWNVGEEVIKTRNPFIAVERIGEGISQQAENIISAVGTGNIAEISKESGSLYSQGLIARGVKTATGKYGAAISEAESQIWIKGQTTPVENPLFKGSTLYNELGIKNANPPGRIPEISTLPREVIPGMKVQTRDPLSKYYLIPPEYTEIGKNFNKGEAIINPKEAAEIKPGNIIKELQPTDFESKLYYKEPGNKPPELQTRLSIEEAPPSNTIRSPQEILELNKRSEQLKLGEERGSRTNFFENPERKAAWQVEEALKKAQEKADAEYKERLSAEADARNKNLIMSSQPLAAAGMVIMEEWPKISDILKEKYAIYKGESLREGNIIIREAPVTGKGRIDLIPRLSTEIQNPTKTGIMGGTTSIIKYQLATKIDTKANIRIRSISGIKSDQATRIKLTSGLISSIKIDQAQTQEQSQSQIQGQQQAQRQMFKQAQITTLRNTAPPETPTPFIFPKAKEKERKTRQPGITIKVRRRGIFQNMGTEENIFRAKGKAENIVQGTAAASYKLERQGRIITDFNPGRSFSPSRREPGVFIQKRSNRISSPGEKSEITSKGIMISKFKRRRNPWAF